MYDQTLSLVAIGVFILTILEIVFVVVARRGLAFEGAMIVKVGLSTCFLAIAALAWSLCYMGFVSGVMPLIKRGRLMDIYSASDPTSYWIALAFAYFFGVLFLWIGALVLFAPRANK